MARSHGGVRQVLGGSPAAGEPLGEDELFWTRDGQWRMEDVPAPSKSPQWGQEGERPLIMGRGLQTGVATCNPYISHQRSAGTCTAHTQGDKAPGLPGTSTAGRPAITYRASVCSPNACCEVGRSTGTAPPHPTPRDPSDSAETRFWEVRKPSPQKLRDS